MHLPSQTTSQMSAGWFTNQKQNLTNICFSDTHPKCLNNVFSCSPEVLLKMHQVNQVNSADKCFNYMTPKRVTKTNNLSSSAEMQNMTAQPITHSSYGHLIIVIGK